MGAYDSSIKMENLNNTSSAPISCDSYENNKIILNSNNNNINLTKSFKEIISANKNNLQKIEITNKDKDINNLVDKSNSKNNLIGNKINKVTFFKCINTSKTVDKKQININLNATPNNQNNINKSGLFTNSLRDSLKAKKISFLKDNPKKARINNETIKNININNINIQNKSGKDMKPFYYKPKAFCSTESNNKNHRNEIYNNIQINKKLNKKKILKNLALTKSKDKSLSKNESFKDISKLTRTEVHRSFNDIFRISSKDKLNILNNHFRLNKKLNFKLEHVLDVHDYYKEQKNRPLYIIDDINDYEQNKNENINYSTENDFNNIIRNNKNIGDINKIYIELLKLKERKWQEELINISKIISANRTPKYKIQNINIYNIFYKILLLYDHFNWILNSIAFVFSSIFYDNKNEPLINYNMDSFHFPNSDSPLFWFKGFKWKGLYIRVDKDIDCKNNIKKEIKALNYFFLDYIHIIWNKYLIEDINNDGKHNILSNNIIFPLIGYCQINSFVLIVSTIIKPELNDININLDDLVEQSKGKIELYSRINVIEHNISVNKIKNTPRYQNKIRDNLVKNNNDFSSNYINKNEFNKKSFLINKLNHSIDYNTEIRKDSSNKLKSSELKNEKDENINNINSNSQSENSIMFFNDNYYINDLLKSKLFSKINKNNLIKIKNGKYILINIAEYIPNLFENKFKNDIKKLNFFGVVDEHKKFITLNYNTSLLVNLKNIFEKNNIYKKAIEYYDFLSPKIVLEKIYKIKFSPKLNLKNVIIGNIIFRILYFNISENRKNSKKRFVDFLFNYNFEGKKKNLYQNDNTNIYMKKEKENIFVYVQEPYVILYDLIEPIKIDYSLIKSIKNNDSEVVNNMFFLRTNYINYFMSWCEMFNKNSYNIKRYCDLKYFMKKFGINQNLLFFALLKINNDEITDIIKIHLLVKAFKFICFNEDNKAVIDKIKKNSKYNDLELNENLKTNIYFYIKSILYPNEILPLHQKVFKSIYEQLLFFANILFFKFRLIDDYLSLGLLNVDQQTFNQNEKLYSFFNIQNPQQFLKHCILISRKKPFLFLSELEYKLNFIIDPYIKFKSSISLESMSRQLNSSHVEINNNIIKSFIDPKEISGLILTKIIKKYNEKTKNINNKGNIYDSYKKNNENNISNKIYNFETANNEPKINNVIYHFNNNKENLFKSKNKNEIINQELDNEIFNDNLEDNKSNNIPNKINWINNNSNNPFNSNDNNEILSKLSSSDKTMDETKLSNPKIILDKNKNNINNNSSKIDFKEINKNIIFFMPANCHKITFNYEKNITYNNSKNIYANLSQYYSIKHSSIIKEWVVINENIFRSLSNSNCFSYEKILIKSYIFLFLYFYFIERNKKDFLRVRVKLISLFKNNINYNLTMNEISLINLIFALSNEHYIKNEEYFSKCVMSLLICYGDPRGRNNDSHGFLQFPLWEIARKTYKLDETIINENFKEMYQSLDFFEKNKGIYDLSSKKNSQMFNYNFGNNVKINVDKIKMMNIEGINNIIKKGEKNDTNNNNNNNLNNNENLNDTESIFSMVNNIDEIPNEININKEITELDISLNKSFFDKINVEKMCINHYLFPSISSKIIDVSSAFYRKEFIIYFIKELLSLYFGDFIAYPKNYLEKKISDELIIIREMKDINKNKSHITQQKIEENSIIAKYNQTPLKIKNINNENIEKKIQNSSLKTNSYLKIDKKYNNRNYQKLHFNKNFRNNKNSKSYNNFINKPKISKNFSSTDSYISSIKTKKTIINNNNSNNKINNINNKINNDIETKNKKIFSNFLYEQLYQKLSYKKNLPNGIVISFGNNKHNETSHDRYEKLTLPRVIFKLKNETINNIYSGWEHNIVLNNKGEIFSFGHNQYYQCGLPNMQRNFGNTENINDPTNISILHNNLKAIKVSCGNEHSLILAQDKNVYGFGNNEGGLLGINNNKIRTYKPIKINFLNRTNQNKNENYNGKIKDITCGTMHNLALTEDGKIFSWGCLQGGQLGLPSDYLLNTNKKLNSYNNFYLSNPTLIPYFRDNNIKISQISCGEAHSLALNNKGNIYSWGFGSNGQLGLGFCEDCFEPGQGLVNSRIFEPKLIQIFRDYNTKNNEISSYNYSKIKINEIKCGKTFSMFISEDKSLFACGINDLGQLGFKDSEKKELLYYPEIQCFDYIYPSRLRCFNNKKVEKISCGEGHCLAIINDINSNTQSIWSWGNNNFGQIGHGLMVKTSLPKEVEYLKEYNINHFSDVSCGGFHSLILLKSKYNLDWIEKDYEEYILGIIKEIGEL